MTQQRDQDRKGFLHIGGRPFTIEELGPAADMRIDEGLQYMIDQGMVGHFPPGTPWYRVFNTDSFSVIGVRSGDGELLEALWQDYKAVENEVLRKSEITDEDRSRVIEKRDRFLTAKKLSTP